MATLFTKIIDGDIPGHYVWKDDLCVAFLVIDPDSGATLAAGMAGDPLLGSSADESCCSG